MIRCALVAGLVLLGGCDTIKQEIDTKIKIPPIPSLDPANLQLPKTADGKYLLMELSQARIEIDPTLRDPLTALGECADQIAYCYSPTERSLDDCVRSVKGCDTPFPWLEPSPCCPKQCQADYASQRTAGVAGPDALDKVLFVDHQCFPGINNALEGR